MVDERYRPAIGVCCSSSRRAGETRRKRFALMPVRACGRRGRLHFRAARCAPHKKKLFTLLDLCVSSLRRGHANLLCIVPILTDDPRRESDHLTPSECRWPAPRVAFGAAIAAVSTPCATAHEDSQLPACAPLPTQRLPRNCKAALRRCQRGDGPPPQRAAGSQWQTWRWLTAGDLAPGSQLWAIAALTAVNRRDVCSYEPPPLWQVAHNRSFTTVRLRDMGSCEQSLRCCEPCMLRKRALARPSGSVAQRAPRARVTRLPVSRGNARVCAGCIAGRAGKNTHRGARTHDHKVKSLALCRLS